MQARVHWAWKLQWMSSRELQAREWVIKLFDMSSSIPLLVCQSGTRPMSCQLHLPARIKDRLRLQVQPRVLPIRDPLPPVRPRVPQDSVRPRVLHRVCREHVLPRGHVRAIRMPSALHRPRTVDLDRQLRVHLWVHVREHQPLHGLWEWDLQTGGRAARMRGVPCRPLLPRSVRAARSMPHPHRIAHRIEAPAGLRLSSWIPCLPHRRMRRLRCR